MSGFSDLEARVARVTLAKLANARLTCDALSVDGVFEAAYQEALGVAGLAPMFRASTDALAGVGQGARIAIDCVAHGLVAAPHVVAEAHADAGMTVLLLRKGS